MLAACSGASTTTCSRMTAVSFPTSSSRTMTSRWARGALGVGSGQAYAVRLDDMAYPGGDHGAHVVTIVPRGNDDWSPSCAKDAAAACVCVRWIPLPSGTEP